MVRMAPLFNCIIRRSIMEHSQDIRAADAPMISRSRMTVFGFRDCGGFPDGCYPPTAEAINVPPWRRILLKQRRNGRLLNFDSRPFIVAAFLGDSRWTSFTNNHRLHIYTWNGLQPWLA